MGLFRKRIDREGAARFFSISYSKTLSSREMVENIARLARLKEAFPVLKSVRQDDFDRNLAAVNLVWLRIAWVKYCGLAGGVLGEELEAEVRQRVPAYGLIDHLVVFYQRAAHGSGPMNASLATAFVAEIMGEDDFRLTDERDPQALADVITAISALFLETFETYTRALKRSRAVR